MKWWGVVLIVLGVLLLAFLGYTAYGIFCDQGSLFDLPSATAKPAVSTEPSAAPGEGSGEAAETASPSPTLSPEEEVKAEADYEFMKNKVNILLLGWDESTERNDESSALYRDESNNFRSDVMMLLTIDFDAKTAKLISIPRDTLAPIFNTDGHWKINAAFAKGGSAEGDGFNYAMNTVSDLFGVPISYYMGVNMNGVKDVVDAMGGVDYDVDCTITLNGRVLSPGYQHLDGQQVLDYCRARKKIVGGVNSDLGRADRQQRILFAIFEQLKSRNQLANLPKIYASVQDEIETNLSLQQIAALAVFAMDLDSENLTRATLEGEYINKTIYNNASFYVLYQDKLCELVKDTFGIEIEPDMRYDVSYVKGDIAARDATPYLNLAEYILATHYTQSDTFTPLTSEQQAAAAELTEHIEALRALTERGEGEEEEMRVLSEDDINAERASLTEVLIRDCTELGYSKQDFPDKKSRELWPDDLYNALPDTPPVTVDLDDIEFDSSDSGIAGFFDPFTGGTEGEVDPEA